MPTVDVVDLTNAKVGEVELADAVFGVEVNEALIYEAVRNYRAGLRAGTHSTRCAAACADRARNCGSRRVPAGRAWVPCAARFGGMAVRFTDRNRAIIHMIFRARWRRARFGPR